MSKASLPAKSSITAIKPASLTGRGPFSSLINRQPSEARLSLKLQESVNRLSQPRGSANASPPIGGSPKPSSLSNGPTRIATAQTDDPLVPAIKLSADASKPPTARLSGGSNNSSRAVGTRSTGPTVLTDAVVQAALSKDDLVRKEEKRKKPVSAGGTVRRRSKEKIPLPVLKPGRLKGKDDSPRLSEDAPCFYKVDGECTEQIPRNLLSSQRFPVPAQAIVSRTVLSPELPNSATVTTPTPDRILFSRLRAAEDLNPQTIIKKPVSSPQSERPRTDVSKLSPMQLNQPVHSEKDLTPFYQEADKTLASMVSDQDADAASHPAYAPWYAPSATSSGSSMKRKRNSPRWTGKCARVITYPQRPGVYAAKGANCGDCAFQRKSEPELFWDPCRALPGTGLCEPLIRPHRGNVEFDNRIGPAAQFVIPYDILHDHQAKVFFDNQRVRALLRKRDLISRNCLVKMSLKDYNQWQREVDRLQLDFYNALRKRKNLEYVLVEIMTLLGGTGDDEDFFREMENGPQMDFGEFQNYLLKKVAQKHEHLMALRADYQKHQKVILHRQHQIANRVRKERILHGFEKKDQHRMAIVHEAKVTAETERINKLRYQLEHTNDHRMRRLREEDDKRRKLQEELLAKSYKRHLRAVQQQQNSIPKALQSPRYAAGVLPFRADKEPSERIVQVVGEVLLPMPPLRSRESRPKKRWSPPHYKDHGQYEDTIQSDTSLPPGRPTARLSMHRPDEKDDHLGGPENDDLRESQGVLDVPSCVSAKTVTNETAPRERPETANKAVGVYCRHRTTSTELAAEEIVDDLIVEGDHEVPEEKAAVNMLEKKVVPAVQENPVGATPVADVSARNDVTDAKDIVENLIKDGESKPDGSEVKEIGEPKPVTLQPVAPVLAASSSQDMAKDIVSELLTVEHSVPEVTSSTELAEAIVDDLLVGPETLKPLVLRKAPSPTPPSWQSPKYLDVPLQPQIRVSPSSSQQGIPDASTCPRREVHVTLSRDFRLTPNTNTIPLPTRPVAQATGGIPLPVHLRPLTASSHDLHSANKVHVVAKLNEVLFPQSPRRDDDAWIPDAEPKPTHVVKSASHLAVPQQGRNAEPAAQPVPSPVTPARSTPDIASKSQSKVTDSAHKAEALKPVTHASPVPVIISRSNIVTPLKPPPTHIAPSTSDSRINFLQTSTAGHLLLKPVAHLRAEDQVAAAAEAMIVAEHGGPSQYHVELPHPGQHPASTAITSSELDKDLEPKAPHHTTHEHGKPVDEHKPIESEQKVEPLRLETAQHVTPSGNENADGQIPSVPVEQIVKENDLKIARDDKKPSSSPESKDSPAQLPIADNVPDTDPNQSIEVSSAPEVTAPVTEMPQVGIPIDSDQKEKRPESGTPAQPDNINPGALEVSPANTEGQMIKTEALPAISSLDVGGQERIRGVDSEHQLHNVPRTSSHQVRIQNARSEEEPYRQSKEAEAEQPTPPDIVPPIAHLTTPVAARIKAAAPEPLHTPHLTITVETPSDSSVFPEKSILDLNLVKSQTHHELPPSEAVSSPSSECVDCDHIAQEQPPTTHVIIDVTTDDSSVGEMKADYTNRRPKDRTLDLLSPVGVSSATSAGSKSDSVSDVSETASSAASDRSNYGTSEGSTSDIDDASSHSVISTDGTSHLAIKSSVPRSGGSSKQTSEAVAPLTEKDPRPGELTDDDDRSTVASQPGSTVASSTASESMFSIQDVHTSPLSLGLNGAPAFQLPASTLSTVQSVNADEAETKKPPES